MKRKTMLLYLLLICISGMLCKIDAQAADTMNIQVQVEYGQTEARSMLQMINEFRTGTDAWYYGQDGSVVRCNNLKPLVYDYDLEKYAMQRAAEVALSFEHVRPNGKSWSTGVPAGYGWCGENLAAGNSTAASTFEQWQEKNDNYSGQGHRRNMLSSSCGAIGIGHVVYRGKHYWAQSLGGSSRNVTTVVAVDGSRIVDVEILNSYISNMTLNNTLKISVENGVTTALPGAAVNANITDHWPATEKCFILIPTEWTSGDETVATIANGKVTGISVGTITLSSVVLGQPYTAQLEVFCKHKVTEDIAAVAPGCESTGLTVGKKCSKCDEILQEQEVVKALGHDEVVDSGIAATCDKKGLSDGLHCKRCDKVLKEQEEVDALGHDYEIIEGKEATCEEDGYSMKVYCKRCDKVYVQSETVKALGHQEEVLPSRKATCKEEGLTEGKKCIRCQLVTVRQEKIDKLEHTLVTQDKIEATCEKDGVSSGAYCLVCGEIVIPQTVIKAFGHSEVVDEAVAPTCEVTGLTEGSHCETCKKVIKAQAEIKALGHDKVVDEAVAVTCEEDGKTEGSHCSRCDKVFVQQKVIEALGHDEAVLEAVDATCLKAGKTEGKMCSRCQEILVEQKDIEALGHAVVFDAAVPAGCESTGLTKGTHCTRCQEVLEEQIVLKALGHSWDLGTTVEAVTQSHDGTKKYTCECCKKERVTIIPASGNPVSLEEADIILDIPKDGDRYVLEYDPEGNVTPQVTVMIGDREIDPECYELIFDNGIEIGASTIVVKGEKNCVGSKSISFEVECTHIPVVDSAKEAACEVTGLTEGSHCEKCNVVLKKQEIIPAKQHVWDAGVVTKQPSVDQKGKKTYTCGLCKKTKQEDIPCIEKPSAGGTTTEQVNDKNTNTTETNSSSDKDSGNTSTNTDKAPSVGSKITGRNDGEFVVKSNGKSKEVEYSKPAKKSKNITVPDTIKVNGNTYKVTTIANNAFKNNKNLTSVTIGKNVTKIGKNAFNGCKNLKKIKIKSKKIKKIGAHAFKKIHKKAKFKYPSSKKKAYKKMLKKALK